MLKIEDLEVSYLKNKVETTVIRKLNMTVKDGTILAVLGRSGCGKTTLLHTIAGVLNYRGRIEIDGQTLSPKQTRIGLIPQDYGLLSWQTVLKNCLFGVGYKNPQAKKEAVQLLSRMGILELAGRYPEEISGGQAQRVALCRALLIKPQILLMDEPFSALDEAAAREAEALTLKMWEETAAIGIIITHRLEEALYLADEIAIMSADGTGSIEHRATNAWKGSMDVTNPAYLELKNRMEQRIMGQGER